MTCPKITVIVPIYNAEKTLRRCIDSILNQSFSDFELLLINDGSNDRSGLICDEYSYKDSRIKVFHKLNGGVSTARNLGLDRVVGQWITFCDADDYVASNWLSLFVSQCSPDVQMVAQGLCFINYKTKMKNYRGCNYIGAPSECLQKLAEKSLIGYCCVKLFSSSVISRNKIRFNENFTFREDEDFVLRYLKCINKISCIEQGAYFYEMPDLSTKYLSVDNFYTSLSMFYSVQSIYPLKNNVLYQSYLLQLTNALFHSFTLSLSFSEKQERLNLYKCLVSVEFQKMDVVSKLTKKIYCMNNFSATVFFILKGYLFNVINVLRRVKK